MHLLGPFPSDTTATSLSVLDLQLEVLAMLKKNISKLVYSGSADSNAKEVRVAARTDCVFADVLFLFLNFRISAQLHLSRSVLIMRGRREVQPVTPTL